jgi:hypothetical protein
LGPDPESRRDVPVCALEGHGLAGTRSDRAKVRPIAVAVRPTRAPAASGTDPGDIEATNKKLTAHEESEGFLALIAELSLRAVREELRQAQAGDEQDDIHQGPH